MTDSKSVFASKTVWGAVIALVASGLGLLGIPFAEGDQAQMVELATQAATLIGAALALYGRIAATRKLRA